MVLLTLKKVFDFDKVYERFLYVRVIVSNNCGKMSFTIEDKILIINN
jgi:hypothetical protein